VPSPAEEDIHFLTGDKELAAFQEAQESGSAGQIIFIYIDCFLAIFGDDLNRSKLEK
jgi:hypothetical protein